MRGAVGVSKSRASSGLQDTLGQKVGFAKVPRRNRFQLIRSSLGVKIGVGGWWFDQGALLDGVLVKHPINAARKVIIRTDQGTFSLNEEDVQKL